MALSTNKFSETEAEGSRKIRISKEPDERRQEIVETALELFSEKGYENTTIQDIAERMNVSPGLCYRYFKSKTDIFAATSEFYAIQAVEQMKIPISQDIPAVEKLNLVINRMFDFSVSHHEFESRYNECSSIRAILLDDVAYQWMSVMIPIIEQGMIENTFSCKNATRTAQFLISGLIHTFHAEMPEENAKEYMQSFFDFTQDMLVRVLGIKID
ncbi:TetR/AcrR family transcriptional regulator [Aminipila sp.]|uniref:TetR/AcrR family transcriptional regulator n=1 Tax=Aminipila sp. TaxID=2060095 RepID=UPI002897D513|nr:TetR/AcrR family transcriptional regulator [Aminipila sp.]